MNRRFYFILIIFVAFGLIKQIKEVPLIRIGFTGDVMLGRLVNEYLKQNQTRSIWGNMRNLLQINDFNIINLETTITTHLVATPKVFNFRSEPKNVQALKDANIALVNLANNHSLDFGLEGLKETIETLDKAKILHVGAGMNLDQAMKPAILEKNGIKIGVIGFTDNEPGWAADPTKPGINYVKVGDIETIKKTIMPIRNQVDILILTIHWGPNMRQKPSQEFIDFAHQIMDAGVDILQGHSAHVLQGIEIYNKKLIMYDTGDFIDDYAVDPILRNNQTFLFNVTIGKKGIKEVTLIPALIENMQVNRATNKVAQEIIDRMVQLSAEFGTKLEQRNSELKVNITQSS